MEVRQDFLGAGGEEFRYIPCLNEAPAWIQALGNITERQLAGWPTQGVRSASEAERSRAHALALGAKN